MMDFLAQGARLGALEAAKRETRANMMVIGAARGSVSGGPLRVDCVVVKFVHARTKKKKKTSPNSRPTHSPICCRLVQARPSRLPNGGFLRVA